MGFRFRRSIRLGKGVRINLSKSGASLSLGHRGATINIGKSGVHETIGLPGTGLSYRTGNLAKPRPATVSTPSTPQAGPPAWLVKLICWILFFVVVALVGIYGNLH